MQGFVYFEFIDFKSENQMKSLILLVILSHAISQKEFDEPPRKPETCHASPDFMYRQCCIFPPFFTRDIARACGAIFQITFHDDKNNVTGLRRRALTGCRHWHCVLDKYDLLTELGYVDQEKYYIHLDLWVELNPAFTDVMSTAKVRCKNEYRYFFPLKPCEFYNLHGCIRNYINVNCPSVMPTAECKELMEFYAQCRDFFIRK